MSTALRAHPQRSFGAGNQRDLDVAVGEPLVGDDGTVAQQWLMTGTHTADRFPHEVPATGRNFSVPGTDLWSVDADGRATVVRAYYDAADLARRLGLA